MPGASSLAGALAGFCGAPLADFVGAVDMLVINQPQRDAIFLKAYLADTVEALAALRADRQSHNSKLDGLPVDGALVSRSRRPTARCGSA